MINGERASFGRARVMGWTLCYIYLCVCMCVRVRLLVQAHTNQQASGGPLCLYVCVLIDSLSAIFKPSLHPQPRGYLCLPAVCYLKGTQKFAGDTCTQAAYLTRNRKSAAFLTSLPLCLPLQGMFFQPASAQRVPSNLEGASVPVWQRCGPEVMLCLSVNDFST